MEKTTPNKVAIKDNYQLSSVNQMTEMSNILKNHIVKQKLFTTISGKNYAHVEGWQFAGGLIGLVPIVTEVNNLSSETEIKWQAKVEITDIKTDKIVGRGFAICSNKENKKKSFDEYAVLSMAQTRAIGKAYRNLIGWVMKLAGYEATPSEEMTAEELKEKTSEMFDKAKKIIKEQTDTRSLKEFKDLIFSSKKYSEKQKSDLIELIDARIEELC